MHTYPTNSSSSIFSPYGRHIQALVAYIAIIKDKTMRTQYAETLITLIQKIHYAGKKKSIELSKLWRNLWIMSNYQLDIDPTYPKPKKNVLAVTQHITYNTTKQSEYTKYYGYNIINYISKLAELSDKAIQEALLIRVVRLMDRFHKKNNSLDLIFEHIQAIGGEKLANHFESIKKKISMYMPGNNKQK